MYGAIIVPVLLTVLIMVHSITDSWLCMLHIVSPIDRTVSIKESVYFIFCLNNRDYFLVKFDVVIGNRC